MGKDGREAKKPGFLIDARGLDGSGSGSPRFSARSATDI